MNTFGASLLDLLLELSSVITWASVVGCVANLGPKGFTRALDCTSDKNCYLSDWCGRVLGASTSTTFRFSNYSFAISMI